jgi:hypothetical protein
MERIAWRSAMQSERGAVLRRALLQKIKDFPIQNISKENGRFPYTILASPLVSADKKEHFVSLETESPRP